MKTVLCVGGSDPSGGAGIQSDIPAVLAHDCFPLSAITSLTSQNSQGVYDVFTPDPHVLRDQLEVLSKDYNIDAVKIGMLGSPENVKVMVNFILDNGLGNIVVDPIFKSSSGFNLISQEGFNLIKEKLLPLTTVVTPNIEEAEYLSQINIKTAEDMMAAAKTISEGGAGFVIIKGGHLSGDSSSDIVLDENGISAITSEKLRQDLRGTGCLFSSSLAANLAKGLSLIESARKSKDFVTKMIKNGFQLGEGKMQVTSFKEKN